MSYVSNYGKRRRALGRVGFGRSEYGYDLETLHCSRNTTMFDRDKRLTNSAILIEFPIETILA